MLPQSAVRVGVSEVNSRVLIPLSLSVDFRNLPTKECLTDILCLDFRLTWGAPYLGGGRRIRSSQTRSLSGSWLWAPLFPPRGPIGGGSPGAAAPQSMSWPGPEHNIMLQKKGGNTHSCLVRGIGAAEEHRMIVQKPGGQASELPLPADVGPRSKDGEHVLLSDHLDKSGS